jgi:molybdopterin biosynthesis enzyme
VLHRPVVTAGTEVDLPRQPDGKIHFVRARLFLDDRGGWRVRPVDGQDSHQLRAMADANALVVLPDGDGVAVGEPVEVMLIDPEQLGREVVGTGSPPW